MASPQVSKTCCGGSNPSVPVLLCDILRVEKDTSERRQHDFNY